MIWALTLFGLVVLVLMAGYPVGFTLAGVSLLVAAVATAAGAFDPALLLTLPSRVFGIMTNDILIAAPLFIFMGVTLQRSRVAEDLLDTMSRLCGALPGGLGLSVMVVGVLLAASTGIVGATVVTLGLLALPSMLQRGYDPPVACGAICASGTLGQIIPPSIVLVLLGDVMSSAFQKAQLDMGIFSPQTVSVADLFAGAMLPGLALVGLYVTYLLFTAWRSPERLPSGSQDSKTHDLSVSEVLGVLVAPLALIVTVLGAILAGFATPTEAASLGAVGSLLLARREGPVTLDMLRGITRDTARVTSMVFIVLIGASIFSLVFRGLGGDDLVHEWLSNLPGGVIGAVVAVMLLMFLLGFVLDFIEITYVVVPLVGPVLLMMGLDPIWLGVMIAINLQTSFLTPPFGFALFYLRGVAPDSVATVQIYRGVMPFIALQVLMLAILALWPELATWLPQQIFGY